MQAAVHIFLPVLWPCTSAWLSSGTGEEACNKFLKSPINIFVFLCFDGRLTVSQDPTELHEGGATVMI